MKALTFAKARQALLAVPVAVVLMAACDETFEPLAPGRKALVSAFGFLNPSADTQWIRVMPIRPLKTTTQDPFDAVVTLTEAGTGRVIALRDSLISISGSGPSTGAATAYVHDFWTTDRIEPGTAYSFSVTRPGEPTSEGVVNVPENFALTVSLHQPKFPNDQDFAVVSGASYVPFAHQILRFTDACGGAEDTLPYPAARPKNGTVTLLLKGDTAVRRGCGQPALTRRHLWVAATDTTWPVADPSGVLALGATERASNLTNALGFLGGLLTREVPYNTCTYESQTKWPFGTSSGVKGPAQKYFPEWCELRFDSTTASSKGRVVETRCGDGVVDSAIVRFTELDDSAKTQLTMTAEDGEFEFGALKPGVPYNLYVYAPLIPVFGGTQFINIYTTVDETVTFTPGEHRTGDLYIQRQTACDQKP